MVTIKANNVLLPSPVDIGTSDEIIWSANTGRSSTGKMIGDVIAEKKTIEISWGVLTKDEFELLKANLKSGFYPFSITIDGEEETITSYRSAISGSLLGTYGGKTYYKSANVTIIQQ